MGHALLRKARSEETSPWTRFRPELHSTGLRRPPARHGADHIAPDSAGKNFYTIDRGLRDLLALYLTPADLRRLQPHFDRLGALAGGRLDELARAADKHPPVLHAARPFWPRRGFIDYHSSYREMEQIAFGDFQFHAMSHRAGVLGMDRPLPAVAKYALQYLFVQAEFGLMCPISVTDTSIHLIRKFASAELQAYLLPKMLSGDLATMWKGTQFMTERAGGSDVGSIETSPGKVDGKWRLSATNGSARMPTPMSRCCWRGPRARLPAPKGWRCSRCRAG
jgi:hypothetical protein